MSAAMVIATLQTDPVRGIVSFRGRSLTVSRREMALLDVLTTKRGSVVTRDEIREFVWSGTEASPRTVDVYVSRLRRALNEVGHPGIETVYQRGYRLLDRQG